jgi:poly(3-hydroxyalkanoate) synthetase
MTPKTTKEFWSLWINNATEYALDLWQRSVLFCDIQRQRGNNYLDHINAGKPPVLIFDYETILDGCDFKTCPVNYSLVRVIHNETWEIDKNKSPVVVIDPRAGHGPGIGGSKKNSQVGIAMQKGHPTYYILFGPEPIPGQTIENIERAEVIFLKEVAKRHPEGGAPVVIGNCQGGWAAALIGADHPDLTGTIILAGSPMSYWAGTTGKNPMRYKGGLCGGAWLTSLMSDLGNGKFDGANLVAGFEDLNPANTYWTKQYHLFSHIDTEAERYLSFEKWWGGFYFMTTEEIHFIIENLFIGNKLEQGQVKLNNEKKIDLTNINAPIIVFSSKGDNITPPQQALNWIDEVYGSVEEIKRQQKVLIYLIHEQVGHLGIFVSSKVASKEHRGIIDTLDEVKHLSPGLYEMKIENCNQELQHSNHTVHFEERTLQDILALGNGREDEKYFQNVKTISSFNDSIYRIWLSPWVKTCSNEFTAQWIRQLHPLRTQRYMISDFNPMLSPIKTMVPFIKKNRKLISNENVFSTIEKNISNTMINSLNFYRDMRDEAIEVTFFSIYSNPFLESMLKIYGLD